MQYIPATKTLAAINAAIEKDQGAAFRVNLGKVIPHMDDAYRGADEGHRSHLGASLLGGECGRALWYGFRWLQRSKFEARILRLFNRGHLEEARFIALLLTIGVKVYQQDSNGKQFRISIVGGHVGGAGDGVGVGLPDLPPGQACLLEFKTHNDKSYTKLVKEGVRVSKPEHFVQMQMYMDKMGIPVAMYGAVNKNDDSLHLELIGLDKSVADTFSNRGRVIVLAQEPPPRISTSSGTIPCRWCDYKTFCFTGLGDVEKNCRTCVSSQALEDGTWRCRSILRRQEVENNGGAFTDELDKDQQRAGCHHYVRF